MAEYRRRMPLVHRFVGLVFLVVIVVGALSLLAAAVLPGHWEPMAEWLRHFGRLDAVSLALVTLFLLAIYLMASLPVRTNRRQLSFDNAGGSVSISTDAICDYIEKLTAEFPSVVKLTPRVVTDHQAIDLVVGVRIKAGPQIHEVCELLQQRVRDSVTQGLGIADIRKVEVSVTDIVSEHKPGA